MNLTSLCESYFILTSLKVISLNNEQWVSYDKVILSEVNDIITIYNLVAETEAETGYGKKEARQAPEVSMVIRFLT